MTDPPEHRPNPQRAAELLQLYFERRIPPDEADELIALWDEFPGTEAEAVRLLEVEALLLCRGKGVPSPRTILEKTPENDPSFFLNAPEYRNIDLSHLVAMPAVDKSPETPAVANVVPYRSHRPGYAIPSDKKQRLPLGIYLFLLFVPLLGLVAFWEFRQKPTAEELSPFHAIATVSISTGTVFDPESPILKQGQRLKEADIRLQSGLLELQLKNGVRLALEGPARLSLDRSLSTFFGQGSLSVFVPSEASGFTVATPTLTVRDIGTEFFLEVDEKQSELHVVSGLVEAKRTLDNVWDRYTEGIGLHLADTGKARQIATNRSRFLSEPIVARRRRENENRELTEQKRLRTVWHADPSLLLHLDADSQGARRERCSEVAGRLSGKRAISFPNEGSVLRSPLECDGVASLTLSALLRIDRRHRYSNTIFVGRLDGRRELHWQINGTGTVQLLVGDDSGGAPLNYESPVVVDPGLLGVWIRMTTVVDADAKEIRFYFDDRQVAAVSMKNEKSFRFNDAEFGNWTQQGRKPTERRLDGAIEEFLLFKRAFYQQEITDMIHPARPKESTSPLVF